MELLKVLPFPHAANKLRNVHGQSGVRNSWKDNSYLVSRSAGLLVAGLDGLSIPGLRCLEVVNEPVDIFLNKTDWARDQGTECA